VISLSSTVINIPDDYPLIQQGIDASSDGDTVLVQPGTYFENINYNGHNIIVGSLFLTTQDSSYIEQTTINGSQNGSVVTFENEEDSDAFLTGFTITNGSGNIMPNYAYCGGGIFCLEDSDPTISYCNIINNNADDGGGIFCYIHCDPIISNVLITNNITTDDGGGLHCNWGSNPILENVKITGNYCADKGAGICCGHNEHPTDLTLNKVLICNNTSGEKGSAIYMVNSNSYFDHVTICNNSTYSIYGSIYCENAYINVNNSIIWNNQNSGFHFYNGGYADVTFSDIQDFCVGTGNISQDPCFVNPTLGNYHLQEISPCIDAGDPNSPPDPDGSITDMGMYYFHQGELINADFSGNPLSGIAPLEVQFTDLSTGNIIGWNWDFDNDGIIDSNEQNPLFTYQQTGIYGVALTVTDGFDEDTEIKFNYITVIDTTNINNNNYSFHTKLNQNFPNPFNPSTVISFELNTGNTENVELIIYNLKGQKIKEYDVTMRRDKGYITWNGTDKSGKLVPSGVYFYRLLEDGKSIATRKMLLMK
jgi:predicted outer membrane repeat protein